MSQQQAFFTLLGASTLGLFTFACDGPMVPSRTMPGYVSLQPVGHGTGALSSVEDCEDFEAAIRDRAARAVVQDIDANLDHALGMLHDPYNFCEPAPPDPCGGFLFFGGCDILTMADGRALPNAGGAGGAESYSTTNNQVTGVDEADLIKNDGAFIYMVGGEELVILRAWPPAETNIIGRVTVPGTPQRLFVRGDRAAVFSDTGTSSCDYDWNTGRAVITGQGLHISIFDLTDRTAPILEREVMANGGYASARRIDDVVHVMVRFPELISTSTVSWPSGLPDNLCNGTELTEEEIREAFAELEQTNLAIVAEAEVTGTIPTFVDQDYDRGEPLERATEERVSCETILLPDNTYANGFMSLMSFDLTDDEGLASTTVVGNNGTVYSSLEGFYVAVSENDGWGESQRTVVHKFGLRGASAAEYRGSGAVEGRLINQFALDEHRGNLRVATTTGHIPHSNNHLFVLGELPGSGLMVIGRVGNIAPTEDIRSVRFEGDRGFMVTFKKTDPLFTFDLSNPSAPVILGELEIPGFSTYMHFLDDDHLLTIGFDADDQGDFAWFQGILLQIFDVTEMQDPRLLHREVIGSRGTSSDATANHLAFTFFGNELAIPIDSCEGGGGGGQYGEISAFNGLYLYEVSVGSGFHLKGRVPHPSSGEYCGDWWTSPDSTVKRSIIMEDHVYSLSSELLKVNAIADLSVDVRQVGLPALNSSDSVVCW